MATAQRLRTHATSHRIARSNQYISKATELDAIINAAREIQWLASQPGRIVIAGGDGRFICKVWNAESFDQTRYDGPHITEPTLYHVGNYVIEAARPLTTEVRSHFLIVEAPE